MSSSRNKTGIVFVAQATLCCTQSKRMYREREKERAIHGKYLVCVATLLALIVH